jgi:hypothetical protein
VRIGNPYEGFTELPFSAENKYFNLSDFPSDFRIPALGASNAYPNKAILGTHGPRAAGSDGRENEWGRFAKPIFSRIFLEDSMPRSVMLNRTKRGPKQS